VLGFWPLNFHIYTEKPSSLWQQAAEGWFLCALGDGKLCCGGVFPSLGGCLRANVSDGANVRCRSEVPVTVRFG